MGNGFFNVLLIGSIAILLRIVILYLLINRELGPFVSLTPAGRWKLTAAFGLGILALTIKMTALVLMCRWAAGFLFAPHPLIRYPLPDLSGELDYVLPPNPKLTAPAPYVWETLPTTASSPPGNPASEAKVALGCEISINLTTQTHRT